MLQSVRRMRYGNLGFQPDHLIAATLHLTAPRYRDYSPRLAFFDQLLERAHDVWTENSTLALRHVFRD